MPTLIAAIEKVLDGKLYLSPRATDRVLMSQAGANVDERSPLERLSDREMDVYQRLGQGMGTKQIAQELHLSPKTVEYHRFNIKKKLRLDTAAALVRHATAHVLGKENDAR
ncbi:Oxygen regulatory protein NreC [Planctomyces sp. SH-PL14]|nr:Oxygen regulatory protein NreC [Planctomyces sp. SH-PL14]